MLSGSIMLAVLMCKLRSPLGVTDNDCLKNVIYVYSQVWHDVLLLYMDATYIYMRIRWKYEKLSMDLLE